MATVNKSSLRAEFDALKARFESLCAAGKMSADSRALFDALLMLFELLMAVFMEKHTPKSSANSSLPASQSPNDDTARTRPGAKGKGPSSNGERCANTRTREYVKVLSVDACGRCGEDLKRMKRLLLGACHQVSKRDDKTLTPSEYKALQKRYRTILTQGARELPPIPPRQNGQRGKVAKSDAHNLWERMRNYETAVLRFAKHPDVAFTNNRAERDLRMAKVKQKVSGCFRTRKYAEAYCRISSYLQSMANQGYNPLVAIQIALAGRAVDNMGE